jgi:mycothiol synthase
VTLPAGYTVRPATEDDVDAVVAVANAYDVADFGRADTAREHVADDFRDPGFDLERNTWLVLEPGGRVVAFGLSGVEHPGVVEAFGRVHPEHADRGIGSFLVGATEGRAAELVRGGAEALLIHNSTTSTDVAARRLMDARRYRLVRYFWHMERSLGRADLEVPEGRGDATVVLAVDGGDEMREARVALDEAFHEHWLAHPWDHEEWRRHLRSAEGAVLVALLDGEVAGVVTFRPTSHGGWIEELGVREPWRGRGLGALLLRHAFARLAETGMHEVRLNVDTENATGATRLYERVGMRVRREWLIHEKPAATAG